MEDVIENQRRKRRRRRSRGRRRKIKTESVWICLLEVVLDLSCAFGNFWFRLVAERFKDREQLGFVSDKKKKKT